MLSTLLVGLVSGVLGLFGPLVGTVNRILFESGGSPITILQGIIF